MKELLAIRSKYNLIMYSAPYIQSDESNLSSSLKSYLSTTALKDCNELKIKEIVADINKVSELVKNSRTIYSIIYPTYDYESNPDYRHQVSWMLIHLKDKLSDSLISENTAAS